MTLDDLVTLAGGVGKLAEAAGVNYSTVCGWRRTKQQMVPVHRARRVSEALGLPLHLIRPDVWPPPYRRSRRREADLVPA